MFKKHLFVVSFCVGVFKTAPASAKDGLILSTVDAKYRSILRQEFLFTSSSIHGAAMWVWQCVGSHLKTWTLNKAAPAVELCPEAIQRPLDGQSTVTSGSHQAASQPSRVGAAVQPRPDSVALQRYDGEDFGKGRQVSE